jgi:hypothetical protein
LLLRLRGAPVPEPPPQSHPRRVQQGGAAALAIHYQDNSVLCAVCCLVCSNLPAALKSGAARGRGTWPVGLANRISTTKSEAQSLTTTRPSKDATHVWALQVGPLYPKPIAVRQRPPAANGETEKVSRTGPTGHTDAAPCQRKHHRSSGIQRPPFVSMTWPP